MDWQGTVWLQYAREITKEKMMFEDDEEKEDSKYNQTSRYKADAAIEHMRSLGKAEESLSTKEYEEKKESARKNLLQSRIISLSHTFVKVFPSRFKTAEDAQQEIEDRLAKGESIHTIAAELHNDPDKIEKEQEKWDGVLSGATLRDTASEREKIRKAAAAAE